VTTSRHNLAAAQSASPLVQPSQQTTARPRRIAACGLDDWREQFRAAMHETGCTQDVIAAVLGVSQQRVSMLVRERIGLDQLEQLRDDPATRDLWLAFMRRHLARGGAAMDACASDGLDHAHGRQRLVKEMSEALCAASVPVLGPREHAAYCQELREAIDAAQARLVALEQQKAVG